MSNQIKGINLEKIGLDSSAIICLAIDVKNLEYFKKHFCKFDRKFYFSVESEAEVIGVLINKYFFNPEDARATWKNISEEIELNLINWGENTKDKEFFFNEVKEINNMVAQSEKNPSLIIGDMDARIISNFYFKGIKKVYTLDKAFIKTCSELDIINLNFPKEFIQRMNTRSKK